MRFNIILKSTLILLVYAAFSFLLLWKIFFLEGIITGGDWAVPHTPSQMKIYIDNTFSSWLSMSSLVGGYRSYLTDFPISAYYYAMLFFGVSSALTSKILLLSVYTITGVSMYAFLRYMKCATLPAFFGGCLYIMSPFVFNYSAMGWVNVLFSMGLFPLFLVFFHSAIMEKVWYKALIAGLIFSFALVQSTSLIWYSLAMFAILFTVLNKEFFLHYVRSAATVFLVVILLHNYWIVNLLLYSDPLIYGSENVLSSVSLGTWSRLNFLNIIRGWGSLYNYSFAISYVKELTIFSYTATIFAAITVLLNSVKIKTINKFTFVILFIFPLFLYFLGPQIISSLPFANIMRDVARMLVLISFSLVVLNSVLLNELYQRKKFFTMYLIMFFLLLGVHPFLLGSLYKPFKDSMDIRLRTYTHSKEYEIVEEYIAQDAGVFKVIYVPTQSAFNDFSNKDFSGAYREMTYAFATFSPKPGIIYTSDKESQGINKFYNELIHLLKYDFDAHIEYIASILNAKYMVFYFDGMYPEDWWLYDNVSSSKLFENVTEQVLDNSSIKVAIFKIIEPSSEIMLVDEVVYTNTTPTETFELKKILFPDIPNINIFTEYTPTNYSRQSDILALKKETNHYKEFEDLSWHKGWAWPVVTHKPGSVVYKLVRSGEIMSERTASTSRKKLDNILWFSIKRLEEISKFGDKDGALQSDFDKKYHQIKYLLDEKEAHINNKWGLGFTKRFYLYITHAVESGKLDSWYERDLEAWLEDKYSIDCPEICYITEVDDLDNYSILANNADWQEYLDDGRLQIVFSSIEKDPVIQQNSLEDSILAMNDTDKFTFINQHMEPIKLIFEKDSIEDVSRLMTSIGYINLENLDINKEYEISFSYEGDNSTGKIFRFAIVEDVITYKDEYLPGAGAKNITTRKVLTFSDTTGEVQEYSKSFTLNRNSSGVHVYVFGISLQDIQSGKMTNFNLNAVNSPSVYVHNLPTDIKGNSIETSFRKLSSTHYTGEVMQPINSEFNLILKQRFSPWWKLYVNNREIPDSSHYIANAYANGWRVDTKFLPTDGPVKYEVIFQPQKNVVNGLYIAGLTIVLCFIVIARGILEKKK
jgi:hypothetical protein